MNTRKRLRRLRRSAEEIWWRLSPLTPTLRRRERLPTLLNARRLLGTGAEIGVFKGEFSLHLLSEWRGAKLISIDPWHHWDADVYTDRLNFEQKVMDDLYALACQVLSRHGARSEVWRLTSAHAAARVEAGSLDFVYIDAQHREAAVYEDLNLWYPKVRAGGILAGHDYCDGAFDGVVFGLKSAVDRYCDAHRLRLHVTAEKRAPSWYLIKDSG